MEGVTVPYSAEAEASVLGSVLFDPQQITIVAENLINPDFFYIGANKAVYSAMLKLFSQGKPIDAVTLKQQLVQDGSFETIGGMSYIIELAEVVPTTANLEYYIKIVQDKSYLRRLIAACGKITKNCVEEAGETEKIMDSAEQAIFDIMQHRSEKGLTKVGALIPEAMNHIQLLSQKNEAVTGISTGLKDLDIILSGLHDSDLVLIAARPAMGKSSLALNIGQYAAVHEHIPTAYFTLEMSGEQVVTRMLCSEALVDSNRVKTGNLDRYDWEKLFNATKEMMDAPFFIDDKANATINEIRSKCKRLKLKENLGLVIIDYLQLMEGGGKKNSRQEEVSAISRGLKILAKELDVPVIALSQLSRGVESRTDKRPNLSDLRESGAIEQDADIVMFIHRETDDEEKQNQAEILIRKHRNGSTGTVNVCWLGQYTRFCNLEKQQNDGF